MKSTFAMLAAVAVTLATLTGCASTVALHPAADAANPSCASVIVRLPAAVATLPSRETNAQGTGAWGSPATVLLHCGVAVPDPTSALSCVTVDGVDWLRDPAKDPITTFITYGRDPAISVVVDGRTVDGGTALTDLGPAVSIIPQSRKCIAPQDVYQGGVPLDPTATPTTTPTATPAATPTP